MEVMWRAVLSVSLLCWAVCVSQEITCRNGNGVAVDWYILYKVPKLNNKDLTGLEYHYIDQSSSDWLSPIDDPKGALALTLKPLLTHKSESSNFGFISYNDQPPGCSADTVFGHSKGVVMMDKTSGIWLLHSTPNFPFDRKQEKLWPETAARFGQTFICVTFPYGQFAQIGDHLRHIWAFPFDSHIPNDFHPSLKAITIRNYPKPNTPFLPQSLKSLGGKEFRSFAKYSSSCHDGEDLYFHICKQLKSDLSAKTWRGSKEYEDSDCTMEGEVVYTIDYVVMVLKRGLKRLQVTWHDGQDHSKWCVTTDDTKPWTCIADLNKVRSQDGRPGGALCLQEVKVRKQFMGFIEHKEDCYKPTKHFLSIRTGVSNSSPRGPQGLLVFVITLHSLIN